MYNSGMTKILFISSRADYGGGAAQMADVALSLDRRIFSPYAAIPFEEPFFGALSRAGVPLYELPKRRFTPASFFGLLRFVRRNGIGVVHSHGKGAGIFSRLLKVFSPRLAVVHTFHGFHFDTLPEPLERAYVFLEKALARLTDRFVNVSADERDEFVRLGIIGAGGSELIPNFLTPGHIEAISAASSLPAFSAVSTARPKHFVCVARFDEVKRIPFLIRAFARAAWSRPEAVLTLVGDGEELEACRSLAAYLGVKNRVRFTGFRDDAVEIMARCDFYVTASRREGMPLSLVAAMAVGLPVLASDVPGHSCLLSDYPRAALFGADDEKSFVEAFHRAIAMERGAPQTPASLLLRRAEYIGKYESLYGSLAPRTAPNT